MAVTDKWTLKLHLSVGQVILFPYFVQCSAWYGIKSTQHQIHAVESQYLLKQSVDCMIQPGVGPPNIKYKQLRASTFSNSHLPAMSVMTGSWSLSAH